MLRQLPLSRPPNDRPALYLPPRQVAGQGRRGEGVVDVSSQPQLLQIALDKKDVVYTPDWVARDMVEFFKPSGRILEPSCGDGAFLKYLPGADWCEIEKGRDFFAAAEQYDWIIGNPPYSQFKQFLCHSFALAKNIVFVLPVDKPFNSHPNMTVIRDGGGYSAYAGL